MQVEHPKIKADLLEAFGSRRKIRLLISQSDNPLATSVVGVIRSLRYEDESGAKFGAVIVEDKTHRLWDGSLGVFE